MSDMHLANAQAVTTLIEISKQLAKDLKKQKDVKQQLIDISATLEKAGSTKRYFIEIPLSVLLQLTQILLSNQLQAQAVKAFAHLPFVKLNEFPQIQQLAPDSIQQHVLEKYFDVIISKADLNCVLTALVKSRISVKNHMDLLFASSLVLGQSSVPLYIASSSIGLKYSEMPEIFTTFLKNYIKYLKGDEVIFSHRFRDVDYYPFKSYLIDVFLILLNNFPFQALKSDDIRDLFLQIYNGLLFQVPVYTPALQNKYLFAIEKILRIYVGAFPAHVIFDHFNSFIFRILDFQEIPHFYLKAAVLMHLARLLCHDNLEINYFGACSQQNVQEMQQKIEQQFFDPFTASMSPDEQLLHFYFFQRRSLPPGQFLMVLFSNFDCKFTMPDLSLQIIYKIMAQMQYMQDFATKQQKPGSQVGYLDSTITNYRSYYINLAKAAQRYQTRLVDGNSYFNQIQKFMQSCGILDCSKMTFVNQNMEGQDSEAYSYQASTYWEAIQHSLARILDSYSQVYAMQEFTNKFVQFNQDFGLVQDESEIFYVLQLKQKMKGGFDLFDYNPLKAVQKFEEIGCLSPLVRVPSVEDEVASESSGQPQKRVRRTFEEEFMYNQNLIEEWKAYFTNADDWCAGIVKFVMKYVKYSEFNVGISQAAFGELIGGSKIENKALLHYFAEHFGNTELCEPDIPFVQALRMFLSHFKLPGEGYVIDRIMNAFSHQYAVYSNLDHKTLHGLSYAVIMLNTDLHNSSIKNGRMTKEMFITNTKLIDYAKQLSQAMLSQIYDEILQNPFTLGSIEDSKKKFAILQRYFYIDDRDINAQQPTYQPQEKHDDPETEQMKLIPRITRYGMAFQEYIKFGFKVFNDQVQTIDDFSLVQMNFNRDVFRFMIEQLSRSPIQMLLQFSWKGSQSWTTQLCLQNLLKIYLSKNLNLEELRFSILQLYIDNSSFLDVPILQRPKFDDSNTYVEIVNQHGRSQKIEQIPSITEGRLDLIQFIIEFSTYRLISDNSSKFFIPTSEFSSSYPLLTEIMSRCVYFDLLFQRAIPQTNRFVGQTDENFRLDCQEFFTGRTEKSDTLVNNYVQIYKYFKKLGTIEKVQKIIVNASSLCPDEFKHFSLALAKSAEFEQKIFLNIEYAQFSLSRLIFTLSVKLQDGMEEFEQLYLASTKSLSAVLQTANERLGVNIAVYVHQIVLYYLMRQLKQSDTSAPNIFDCIFDPFVQALQNSPYVYMTSTIVPFLAAYLTPFEINKNRQNDFFRAVQRQNAQKEAEAALEEYFVQFLPPKLLVSLISTTTVATSNFIQYNCEIMKSADNSLSPQARIAWLYEQEHVKEISQGICDLHFRLSELVMGKNDENILKLYLKSLSAARKIQDKQNNYAPILFKVCKNALYYGMNVNQSFANEQIQQSICEVLYDSIQDGNEEKLRMNQSLVGELVDDIEKAYVSFDEAKQRFLRYFTSYCIEHFEFDAKTDHCGFILTSDEACTCTKYQHSFLEWIRVIYVRNTQLQQYLFQRLMKFVKVINCGSFVSILKFLILRAKDLDFQLSVLEDIEQFESFGSYCLVFNYYIRAVNDDVLISRALNTYCAMVIRYQHELILADLQSAVQLIYDKFIEHQQPETADNVYLLVNLQLQNREFQGRMVTLRFLKKIQNDMFVSKFKKQIYSALVELCEDEDADIRHELKQLLLQRYKEE